MSHMSASEAYAAAAGTGSGLETGSQPHSFPQFPGENALKHIADKWIQTCETRLGGMGLLSVAKGGRTPESMELRDTPQLPALPAGSSGYERRVEAIHRIAASNAEKAEKRYVLEMRAWNKLYGLVLASVEGVSTLLAQELRTLCAITEGAEDGSNFDGPLAWRVVVLLLTKAERTKEDKKYYKTAEELQLRHHLPDGCPAEDYSKKAHAFVANILPNLAQTYSAEDAGDYVIDLMPRGLRESGRRIRERLLAEGRLTDLVHVVRVCRSLVAEEQTASKVIPTLVAAAETDVFNIMALAETTGMLLDGGNLGHGTPGLAGDIIKWCKGCPHPKGKCFMDPSFAGPLPRLRLPERRAARRSRGRQEGERHGPQRSPRPTQGAEQGDGRALQGEQGEGREEKGGRHRWRKGRRRRTRGRRRRGARLLHGEHRRPRRLCDGRAYLVYKLDARPPSSSGGLRGDARSQPRHPHTPLAHARRH